MKKLLGMALLALPFLAGSAQANGWPFSMQAGGSFYIRGGTSPASPQAGPWYLYWPLEAHFVAPAPTGYPYWPAPMGLPSGSFGGPAYPPPAYPPPAYPPAAVVPPPVMTAPTPPPAAPTRPAPVPQLNPQPLPPAGSQLQLPPYLQPTSYYGQAPSYWYDR